MSEKVYVFVGDGAGIPGLPHQISEQEAGRLGVLDLLEDAIKAKKYVVKPEAKETSHSQQKSGTSDKES